MSVRIEEVAGYMREHPRADRAEIMRALSVSARLVARAEDYLESQIRARRSRLRRVVAVGVLAMSLLATGLVLWRSGNGEAPGRGAASEVEPAASARLEGELYAALDRADPAQVEQARQHLTSPDEAARLAALRYLARVGAGGSAVLALLDDRSERVRRAAIQLLGEEGEAPGLEDRLIAVALASERDLPERLLALDVLEKRAAPGLARRLVPLVRDAQPAVRARSEGLLTRLVGRSPAPAEDPAAREGQWLELISEFQRS